ncbi:cardiolipin synthase B [Schlegelella sp. ID0723]|uniref:Cardiolipin synthase B n=2 Tax=Piscinibacter koreensis TaxID=2742824 RepID=A0A7Y6NN76_9BURK|nr:cardiolipin synthase B [Schlegelella koreensis]
MAPPKAPLQFSASNGRMLSQRQSEAIVERLKRDGKGTDILERHLALEEAITDTPLSVGNRVVLLEDGPATYDAMFAAIRNARDHINMETYILEEDEIGLKFADALIEKQRAGVQVNLIVDSVGTLGTPRAFFTRLREAGIKVLEFNPVNPLYAKAGWNVNQRDHRKLLVVDGQVAFLGGINISSVYSGSSSGRGSGSSGGSRGGSRGSGAKLPWRDTDLQIDGPVVADFQRLFIQTWERQKGEPLAERNYYPPLARKGNAIVRAIGSSPSDPFSLIYATFISAIDAAEREVLLTNAYFVPDPQLRASLIAAVARGVDVKLILPSRTDSWLVFHAGRWHYEELLQGGVKIYERRDALLHAKTAVIDGVWSTVGSTNLDWRSFLHNQELNAVILGADFGERMRAAFARDLADSHEITLDAWRKRSPSVRMKEFIGHMWGYWL